MSNFTTKASNHFTEKGWRVTLAVRLILEILQKTPKLLSVRQIEKQLKSQGENINTSTIYRILEKVETSHLIHEFEGKWKRCMFPENTADAHHFLICIKCQGVEEIFLDYKSAIADQLASEKNFLLKKVHLGFFGTCSSCHQKG